MAPGYARLAFMSILTLRINGLKINLSCAFTRGRSRTQRNIAKSAGSAAIACPDKQKAPNANFAPKLFTLAGVEGLEPSQAVLETGVLPLTPYPLI